LAPDDRELLRTRPAPDALRWCERCVGPGAVVREVYPLAGGTSSAVHAVDVEDHRGRLHRLVLRRLIKSDWLEEEPDALYREAAALDVVRSCPLPTPTFVALDAEAEMTDLPALLMTRAPGSTERQPNDLDCYLRKLAEVLPAIDATAVAGEVNMRTYAPAPVTCANRPPGRPSPRCGYAPSRSSTAPLRPTGRISSTAITTQGNVLWLDGEVSGVVDWLHVSIGSPLVDVGHCRGNVADLFGMQAADRFLDLYRAVSGREDYDVY
jgi:aminoglycoside phosphotransferase (APT) family kinase protein